MEMIQLKNLKNLTDTGEISLKPLTVLVGKNGSGKSSFLRFFPLLKQSAERKT
ncbi:MAG: AAA family ATPase, partial [Magnetococcales bacterium]|nr:AAA family ATPase [Magnetococcales bacterium]